MAVYRFYNTASIVVFMLCFIRGVAEIITKPTGTEVVVGRSTFLNCSTNNPQEIHWFHTKFGSNQDRSFVYGYDQFYKEYIGRFAIEGGKATGAYNLIIQSVKVEDAGLYECQDQNGQGKKASAQLTVLDTDPACEPRMETLQIIGPNTCGIEPGQLVLSCSVKYHGNEAPILKWSNTGDKTEINEGVTHQVTDNNLIEYNLTIKGNSNVKDGDSYFCNSTRSVTLNDGCKSSKIKVSGTGADCPKCAATESCEPYKAALICFFLIILPAAICGTIFAFWFLKIHRPKKLENGVTSTENPRSNKTTLPDAGTEEEIFMLNTPATSHSPVQCTDGPAVKIRTLENQLMTLSETIDQRNKTISELTQKDVSNNETIKSLQLENGQLQAKLKNTEQRLYPKENIDYFDKPLLAHVIELSETGKDRPISEKHDDMSEKNKEKSEKNKEKSDKNKEKSERNKVKSEKNDGKSEKRNSTSEKNIKGKAINGITVLVKELFVATTCSKDIAVYDSKTFQPERNMEIRDMTNPLDITSSKEGNCIYIVDQLNEKDESRVMRIEPTGKVLHQWSTGGTKGRLSTYESNIILCLSDKQLINEYSPEGELILTVRLSPAAKLNNPLHAIKVTSSHFVVSHGDFKDELHRVCVVDLDGEIIKEITKWEKSTDASRTKMKVPLCLLEDNDRSIIVADTDHKRILLLSSMLKYQRKLIEEDNSLIPIGEDNGLKDFPVRLCFDDTQSRLFVAVNKWSDSKKEWKEGRIQIFNIK